MEKISSHKICRICRESAESLISIPCRCQGTVGYIHENCLRLWTRRVKKNVCEICGQKYRFVGLKRRSFTSLFRTFFSRHYFGKILKKFLVSAFLAPLIFVNFRQFSIVVEKGSPFINLSFVPSILMMKSLFYFEFIRFNSKILTDIRFLLINWWTFGWFNELDTWSEDSLDVNFEEEEVLENNFIFIR